MKILTCLFVVSLCSCQGLIDQKAQNGVGGDKKPDPKTLPACATSSTTTENGDIEVNVNSLKDAGVFQGTSLAESFKMDDERVVTAVVLRLKRLGVPTGTLTLRVEGSNSDGYPDGSSLSSVSLDIKTAEVFNITTVPDSYSFVFSAPLKISAKIIYWLKLTPSYLQSDLNVIQWLGSTTEAYTSGKWIYEKAAANSWSEHPLGKDGIFKIICN